MFQQFVAVFLACFFTFVAVFYFVLAKRKRQQLKGKSAICRGQPGSRHWWNHMTFIVFRFVIWGVCVMRVFLPAVDQWLYPFPSLFSSPVQLSGIVLMIAGFCLAASATWQLRQHWRSGIDVQGPDMLVTNGLFAINRNPTFSGVLLAQLGFFLALPTGFTLICLLVGWHAIYVQVSLEERHLRSVFKHQYHQYQLRVSRWGLTPPARHTPDQG